MFSKNILERMKIGENVKYINGETIPDSGFPNPFTLVLFLHYTQQSFSDSQKCQETRAPPSSTIYRDDIQINPQTPLLRLVKNTERGGLLLFPEFLTFKVRSPYGRLRAPHSSPSPRHRSAHPFLFFHHRQQ